MAFVLHFELLEEDVVDGVEGLLDVVEVDGQDGADLGLLEEVLLDGEVEFELFVDEALALGEVLDVLDLATVLEVELEVALVQNQQDRQHERRHLPRLLLVAADLDLVLLVVARVVLEEVLALLLERDVVVDVVVEDLQLLLLPADDGVLRERRRLRLQVELRQQVVALDYDGLALVEGLADVGLAPLLDQLAALLVPLDHLLVVEPLLEQVALVEGVPVDQPHHHVDDARLQHVRDVQPLREVGRNDRLPDLRSPANKDNEWRSLPEETGGASQ